MEKPQRLFLGVVQLLPYVVLFGCLLLCFVFHARQEAQMFFSDQVSMSQHQEPHDGLRLPLIVFCRNPPYRKGFEAKRNFSLNAWSANKPTELMTEAMKEPGLEALWSEATLGWDEFNFRYSSGPMEKVKRSHVDTYNNGRCLTFDVDVELKAQAIFSIFLQPTTNLTMILLNRDQLGQLAMGGRYTRLVYIKSVVLEVANWFFLEKSRSRRLRTEENQCVEDESYDVNECLRKEYEKAYRSSAPRVLTDRHFNGTRCSAPCSIPPVSFFLKGLFPDCATGEDFICAQQFGKTVPEKAESQCAQPCTSVEYRAVLSDVALDNGWTAVEFSYTSTHILAKTEYYIYSFTGVIGTIGGSLGMFLGFSFWHSGRSLIEYLNVRMSGKVRDKGDEEEEETNSSVSDRVFVRKAQM